MGEDSYKYDGGSKLQYTRKRLSRFESQNIRAA